MGSPPLPPLTAPASKGMTDGPLDGAHGDDGGCDALSTEEDQQALLTGADAAPPAQQRSPPHVAAAHRLSHSHSFPSSAPASVARPAPTRRFSYDRDTLEDDEGAPAETALRQLRFEDQLSPEDQLPSGSPAHPHSQVGMDGQWAMTPTLNAVAAQLPPADELEPSYPAAVAPPSPEPSRPPVHNAQPQLTQQPRLQTGLGVGATAASAALAAVHHSRAVSAPELPSSAPVPAPVAVAVAVPAPMAAPVATMPSVPDLSSYSSANLEEDEAAAAAAAAEAPSRNASPDLSLLFGFAPRRSIDASSAQSFSSSSSSLQPQAADADAEPAAPARNVKLLNFQRLIGEDNADLGQLRRMSWSGIPAEVRGPCWKLLLGYLPANAGRRPTTLQKRRDEYARYLQEFYYLGLSPQEYYGSSGSGAGGDGSEPALASLTGPVSRSESEHEVLKQIRQDVPRTSPGLPFFKRPAVQRALERALYIFAIRHPASGYVQGINDLLTPFFTCFMLELLGVDVLADDGTSGGGEGSGGVPEWLDRGEVGPSESGLLSMEADAYWCMSQLIDSIQDHYTFAQPGIQRMVYRLQELILRIDGNAHTTAAAGVGAGAGGTPAKGGAASSASRVHAHVGLHAHLERENVQFIHFAFRWMGCLLMRELRLPLIFRLWDSYLSEGATVAAGFKVLHVYVCAAFLMRWSEQLKKMDFQQIIQFLQKLPTGQKGAGQLRRHTHTATFVQDWPAHLAVLLVAWTVFSDDWTAADVESLLAQAHIYKTLFHASPQHLA